MAAFDDNFELMPATAPPINPPSGYQLEAVSSQSYLSGAGWVVQHGSFTGRYAQKTGYSVPERGWAEIEFTLTGITGFALVFENAADVRNPNVPYINISSFFDQANVGINNTVLATYGIAKNTRVKYRIDRNIDQYRFRIWVNGASIHDSTATSTFGNDGVPRFYHAEAAMSIFRFSADDGTPPAPNPLSLVSKTATSAALVCANIVQAGHYYWYRLINAIWTLAATTTVNNTIITGLTANSSQEFKVQYDLNPEIFDDFAILQNLSDYSQFQFGVYGANPWTLSNAGLTAFANGNITDTQVRNNVTLFDGVIEAKVSRSNTSMSIGIFGRLNTVGNQYEGLLLVQNTLYLTNAQNVSVSTNVSLLVDVDYIFRLILSGTEIIGEIRDTNDYLLYQLTKTSSLLQAGHAGLWTESLNGNLTGQSANFKYLRIVPAISELSDFSDVLVVQLESDESPRLREYETQLPREAPPRLQDFYSQRLLAVLGAVKDDVIDDCLSAIAETFAGTASEKRLLEIGADRLIDRYPTESLESYREAVVNASSILEWRGTAKGIEDEIARFGYTATYIPLRNADPPHWAEFILILRNGRIQRSLGTGGPWDIGMSLLERDALLKLIRRWKNSDERLAMISYSLGNSDFWGEGGTWGDNTTWYSGGTKVIYARPYAWGDNPNDTWNSSQGTWGDTDTYPVQEG